MKKFKFAAIPVIIIFFSAIALAQSSGGDFAISKSTIDGGGTTSAGGEFTLTGTIGQHDASQRTSSGTGYIAAGGFWAKTIDLVFSNGFESN